MSLAARTLSGMPTTKRKTAAASYVCAECGYEAAKWVGRCPECQQWGTITERGGAAGGVQFRATPTRPATRARPITEAPSAELSHAPTGIGELDRVLGGGLVPGAAILLSGEPGVGKSTLLIEMASKVAESGQRVLYITGEESAAQVRLRAERIGALHPSLYLASETDLGVALGHIDEVDAALVIVDSVQTISSSEIDSLAGQPGQVRAVATALIRAAKTREVPMVIVGHVTKDGQVAGPRMLEHLVDVVAHIEGDRQTGLRFVRTLKNRYGATDEVGCFEMAGDGMREVPDPSVLFVSERNEPVPGTAVTIALEGRRALPVEVQALVTETQAPNPRRVANGVDPNRLSMLLAVLKQRCRIDLSAADVYVSTVGGVRLVEPAADLAILAALAAARKNRPVADGVALFGEVSLVGEVRKVTNLQQRINEAHRLGFRTPIGPETGSAAAAITQALRG